MANEDKKRYYWLKLDKDFFKRHDVRIVESMPNGKDYIMFYLKMLCESINHEGNLRFNETIPYNEDMLSTITNTNVDIVRSAIKVFVELGLIELLDDGTYYMIECQKMVGSETGSAIRKREQRSKEKDSKELLGTNMGQCPLEIDIDIDKDIDIYNNKKKSIKEKKSKNSKPIEALIEEYTTNNMLKCALLEFVKMRIKIKKPLTDYAFELMLSKLDKLSSNDSEKIEILNQSITNSWQGIFAVQKNYNQNCNKSNPNALFDPYSEVEDLHIGRKV